MLDTAGREIRGLDILDWNSPRKDSKARKRPDWRYDHDVGTATEAAITETALIGIVS